MNDHDRSRITVLEQKIDRLLNAVIGDDEAGSIGLVVRISRLEDKMSKNWERYEAMEERIEKVEQGQARIFAYSAAIAFIVGTLWQAGKLLFDIWTKGS